MKTRNDFWMDDVGDITRKAHDAVEDGLRDFGIVIDDNQSDVIWNAIWKEVEKYSNGNYKHEM